MSIKKIIIAAVATAALATSASANAFSFNNRDISGSTADLGQVTSPGAGVVSIYDFNAGKQGALLGTGHISAGANYDVRVPLGKRPVNDVVAVLTVNGQVVDSLELDTSW